MAKVLITGGLGFIGSHIQDFLITGGHDVTIIDDLSSGSIDNLNPKANFLKLDISDETVFYELPKVDYVFHLAATASIQLSIANPIKTHKTNVAGTLHLLDYCLSHGAKIIFSSTSAAYSQDGKTPYIEESWINPLSPYALQKVHSEDYTRQYRNLYGLKYAILRYSNVFGPRQSVTGAYPSVTAIFLKHKTEGLPLRITGNGQQRRDYVYVEDVARANLAAMGWEGTFNVGSGTSYSVNELADAFGGKRQYLPARAGEMRDNTLDCTKAASVGWKATVNIIDWIKS